MSGAWTRKEGKSPSGGLNEKGRASLRAKASARAAGRPYPNLVDNAAAARKAKGH